MAFPFGKEQEHAGSFIADDLELTLGGAGGKGSLIQSANFTMTRQINMLYEIGSSQVYYVGNRRQGTCQMTRIVGGSADFKTLITTYGNMCEPKDLMLKAKGGTCGKSKGIQYNMKKATLNSMGMSVTAQDIVITESLGFMFADLDYE